ncbi:MAG: transcription antitermination factor NusB [bacterium]
MMRNRTKAREMTLQILYEIEIKEKILLDEIFSYFWQRHTVSLEIQKFIQELVNGVIENKKKKLMK